MSITELATRMLVLSLFAFASFDACAQYRHKTEAEITAMTPAERVDEYADEQAFHKYEFLDQQHELISKYILR